MASPSTPDKSLYGKLSVLQTIGLVLNLLPLPAIVLWKVLTTSHSPHNKGRSLKRIAGDAAVRHVSSLPVPELQAAFGTDLKMYAAWAKANKLPITVDELGEGSDARLLWLGPKRTEKVVLFLHGGAFLLPASKPAISFWRYVQVELEKKDLEVGFALLEYTLAPYATFPTQLDQARLALDFLFKAGVQPSSLQLVGDSAGGHLILQLLSHTLHPLPSIPAITLQSPIAGAYLISPWTSLSATSNSHKENDGKDFLSLPTIKAWGAEILKGFPPEHAAFAEAVRAPADWFVGSESVFQRVLISAGGAEVLRDDIVEFAETFKKQHKETEFVLQENGLHEDMFLDFMFNEKKVGTLTPLTVAWLAAGFSAK
ncbi:Abhydrolase-3 domain-containing protein [Mycena chlorophos]|uniref:Abhydrolase-3 domain-containing protein n=1 Tax=Mycena chlorophos TaxID=658473 RepID=A0A8H6TQ19_MYCCL|nr:Abhydrolase-3 domain-containing protein [Mycena chlorophos]